MDIAALSMSMSQSELKQGSSIAVMKMVMDTIKATAANLNEMLSQTKRMERSVQPNLGGSLDINI